MNSNGTETASKSSQIVLNNSGRPFQTHSISLKSLDIAIHVMDMNAIPVYASEGAAGADLKACIDTELVIAPGSRMLISTGIKMEIPRGYEVQIRPRSGLALKHGVTVLNTPGTIDSDYRGLIQVLLINLGSEPFTVTPWMRIAQMVLVKVETATFTISDEQFSPSARGERGFGSTGVC